MVNYYLATIGEYVIDTLEKALFNMACDVLYLFPSEATKSAAERIHSKFKDKLGNKNIMIICIDPYDFWKSVAVIMEEINKIKEIDPEAKITVDISGGTRVMSFAAYYAATIFHANTVYFLKDKSGEIKKIGLPPLSLPQYSNHDMLVLKALYEKGPFFSQKELKMEIEKLLIRFNTETRGLSPPRISKRIEKLSKLKLVIWKRKRERKIELTPQGEAYMKILEIIKKYKRAKKK